MAQITAKNEKDLILIIEDVANKIKLGAIPAASVASLVVRKLDNKEATKLISLLNEALDASITTIKAGDDAKDKWVDLVEFAGEALKS